MDKERIILGIDPGTTISGYGLIAIKNKEISVLALGVIDLRKIKDHYLKLKKIFDRVLSLMDEFHPDELAVEAPFYGKNVQSMLKLGRAQGAAIAAALHRSVPIFEYAPRKIKMSITGQGAASKEQVAAMLSQILQYPDEHYLPDATDALAAALCHYYQTDRPMGPASSVKSWNDFIKKNPDRLT